MVCEIFSMSESCTFNILPLHRSLSQYAYLVLRSKLTKYYSVMVSMVIFKLDILSFLSPKSKKFQNESYRFVGSTAS